MIGNTAIERTRAQILIRKAFGAHRPTPGRVPRQILPDLIKREYGAELAGMLGYGRVRAVFAPLLAELPGLLASAANDRLHTDAGEGRRVRALVAAARDKMKSEISPTEIEALAAKFAAQTSTHQRIQLNRQTRSALGIDVLGSDPRLPALAEAFINANVALIEGIPARIAADVESSVFGAIQRGTLHGDLAEELAAKFQYGEDRARLIARDQVGKLYGQINASRQRALGISRFFWRDSGDDRVREEHEEYAKGGPYEYSDPPGGELPGEPILCRCNAEPDFSEILDGL